MFKWFKKDKINRTAHQHYWKVVGYENQYIGMGTDTFEVVECQTCEIQADYPYGTTFTGDRDNWLRIRGEDERIY